MEQINRILSGGILPFFLFAASLFFLFKLKGRPIRGLFRLLSGLKDSGAEGIRPQKAVLMALAGTLGVGNIIGVADAVIKGGAGVIFWMAVSSVAAAVIKYCEVVVSMEKRKYEKDRICGGPMYYIFPKAAAILFSVLCIGCAFSVGSAMQTFAAGQTVEIALGISPYITGLILTGAVAANIFKGQGKLFDLTVKLVPLMTGIYFFLCLSVILKNATGLPSLFGQIFKEAFSFRSAATGTATTAVTALRFGVIRGLLSNEAGCGTAPMAHTASSCKNSPSQGALGIVEVAVDTLVLCTVTGITLLCVPASLSLSSTHAVLFSLETVFGNASGILLSLSVLLFSFATVICWSFYLENCVRFLTEKKIFLSLSKGLLCLFCFLGTASGEDWIWQMSDFSVAAMTVLNLCYLLVYRNTVTETTEMYLKNNRV